MKKIIRLTENDLRGIIKSSVNRVLREHMEWFNDGQITDDAGYVNSIKKFCENPVDMDNYDPSDDDIYDAIGEFNPDDLDTDFSDLMGNNQNESRRKRGNRLSENNIRNIIKKSVNKVLREFGSDGPDFDEYEIPGYEGTNVPDGDVYDELYPEEDFDNYLSDAQYVNEPNIGDSIHSANDIDTDEDLLNMESRNRIGRIIRESINKVLNENGEDYPGNDWQDTYMDNNGNKIQSKGHGTNRKWRTVKNQEPKKKSFSLYKNHVS